MLQCLGTTGTVVGIDEDHDIVVSYPSGNRLVIVLESQICLQFLNGTKSFSLSAHLRIYVLLRMQMCK